MRALTQWFGALMVAFSIGTVISLAVIAGMLWWKGVLTDERIYGMLAALQGIRPPPPPKLTALDTDTEQPSFEQILNARYLEALGYGMCAEPITGEKLAGFLERIPDFERNLAAYTQDGNRNLLAKLDELLRSATEGGHAVDTEEDAFACAR